MNHRLGVIGSAIQSNDAIYSYYNKSNEIPTDFDWIAYRSRNTDLTFIKSYQDAVKHYKMHGLRQNRPYKFDTAVPTNRASDTNTTKALNPANTKLDKELQDAIPPDFDWIAYKALNPDLGHIRSLQDAARHYRDHGKRQNRPYCIPAAQIEALKIPIIDTQLLEQLMHYNPAQLKAFQASTTEYLNGKFGLPDDFDWLLYKNLNSDLAAQINCYQDAAKHYKEFGQHEKRPYKFVTKTSHDTAVNKPVLVSDTKIGSALPNQNLIPPSDPNLSPPNPVPDKSPDNVASGPPTALPANFDWFTYKSLNTDLRHITSYQDAVKHYMEHGWRQQRPYRRPDSDYLPAIQPLEKIATDYDSVTYKPALAISKPNIAISEVEADVDDELPEKFDWLAYRSLNKDLQHIQCQQDAVKHYKEHGRKQDRPYKYEKDTKHTDELVTGFEPEMLEKFQSGFDSVTYKTKVPATAAAIEPLHNDLPDDFDWFAYKSLNTDLKHIRFSQDAIKHYLQHGRKQNRNYKFAKGIIMPLDIKEKSDIAKPNNTNLVQLPPDFNWLAYKLLNSDLKHIMYYQDASKHYLEHGHRQNRPYKFPTKSANNPTLVATSREVDHTMTSPQIYMSSNAPNNLLNKPPVAPADPLFDLPNGFNWIAYRSLNPDLGHIASYKDAIKHYRDHGAQQNRPYKFAKATIPDATEVKGPVPIKEHRGEVGPPKIKPADIQLKNALAIASQLSASANVNQSQLSKFTSKGAGAPRNDGNSTALIIAPRQTTIKTRIMPPLDVKIIKTASANVVMPTIKPVYSKKSDANKDLPPDFDWQYYKSLYADLKEIHTQSEITRHYIEHGKREERQYKRDYPLNSAYIAPTSANVSAGPDRRAIMPIPSVGRNAGSASHPRITTMGKISGGLIPNIIHFIYGFRKQKKAFELFKYIAIKSAIVLNQPDKVYFHYKYEPFGPYWEQIKPLLILQNVEPPTEIFGHKLTHFAHQSDVTRLNVLNRMGGMYFDIDTICLRPLREFAKYDFVMGIQGSDYGLCNAIMMAKPQTEFGINWYEAYRSFNSTQWDHHSVILPLRLSRQYPITILANDALFYPLWDPMEKALFNSQISIEECGKIFQNSYCIHLWESCLAPQLNQVTEKSISQTNTLYNILARKYVKNTFSIVMLTHNRAPKTIECIQSFYNAVKRDDVEEFIVFDNNSNDRDLLKYLKKLPGINKKFRVIFHDDNLGVCGGRAKLFDMAKGDLICSVDSDLSLLDEQFFDIVKNHLYDESIGIIGTSGSQLSKSFKFGSQKDYQEADRTMQVDHVAGCCQVFRKDLKYLGIKLDPMYGKFWVEDTDFCLQIRHLGKTALLIPQKGLVSHVWGGSGGNYMDLFRKNWDYFAQKWKKHAYLCSLR